MRDKNNIAHKIVMYLNTLDLLFKEVSQLDQVLHNKYNYDLLSVNDVNKLLRARKLINEITENI